MSVIRIELFTIRRGSDQSRPFGPWVWFDPVVGDDKDVLEESSVPDVRTIQEKYLSDPKDESKN